MLTVCTVANLKPAQICLHKQPNTPQSEVGMQSVCSSFLFKKKKVGNSYSRIGSGHICYCTFLVWFTPLQWWKTGFWKKLLIEAQIFLCCCSIKSSSCSSRVKVTPKPQTGWFRFRHLNSLLLLLFYPTSTATIEMKFSVFQVLLSISLWSHEGYSIAQSSDGSSLCLMHSEGSVNHSDLLIPCAWWLDITKNWVLANPFHTFESWGKNTHFLNCDMRRTVSFPLFLVLDTVTLAFLSWRWDWLGTSHTESQMQGCQLHVTGN